MCGFGEFHGLVILTHPSPTKHQAPIQSPTKLITYTCAFASLMLNSCSRLCRLTKTHARVPWRTHIQLNQTLSCEASQFLATSLALSLPHRFAALCPDVRTFDVRWADMVAELTVLWGRGCVVGTDAVCLNVYERTCLESTRHEIDITASGSPKL